MQRYYSIENSVITLSFNIFYLNSFDDCKDLILPSFIKKQLQLVEKTFSIQEPLFIFLNKYKLFTREDIATLIIDKQRSKVDDHFSLRLCLDELFLHENSFMKLTIVLIAAFCFFLLSVSPVLAQESDYSCYLHSNHRTVDLSKLCGQSSSPLSSDAAFLSSFQKLASEYPTQVSQALSLYTGQNQASAIAAAKTTCRVIKLGGTSAQETRRSALMSYDAASNAQAKQQITASLAVTHYCPELGRQL